MPFIKKKNTSRRKKQQNTLHRHHIIRPTSKTKQSVKPTKRLEPLKQNSRCAPAPQRPPDPRRRSAPCPCAGIERNGGREPAGARGGRRRRAASLRRAHGGKAGVHAPVAAGPGPAEPGRAAPLAARAPPGPGPGVVAVAAVAPRAARRGGAAVARARAGRAAPGGRRALGRRHGRRVRRARLHDVLLLPLLRLHALTNFAVPPSKYCCCQYGSVSMRFLHFCLLRVVVVD